MLVLFILRRKRPFVRAPTNLCKSIDMTEILFPNNRQITTFPRPLMVQ